VTRGPIRRAQLIAPFGVGAMTVLSDGTSVIAAGLDSWFRLLPGSGGVVDVGEFQVEEWRLQRLLRVSHFRIPPDYRRPRLGQDIRNTGLTVPFLRFPTWNFCPRCRRLSRLPLSFMQRKQCEDCNARRGRGPLVAQVPIVAICDYGHIQDFPWREWVHRSSEPSCEGELFLRATGGASLGAQTVECSCGVKPRSLGSVTEAAPVGTDSYPQTFLSQNVAPDGPPYLCSGHIPWHGAEDGVGCGREIKGSLRAASNVYFGLVKSSIYLPRTLEHVPPKLLEIFEQPPISTYVNTLREVDVEPTVERLRNHRDAELLRPFSDEQIRHALDAFGTPGPAGNGEDGDDTDPDSADPEFRRHEFGMLRAPIDNPALRVRSADLREYDPAAVRQLGRVMLVDQLRETRALWGFNRVFPEGDWGIRDRRAMLWRTPPPWQASWLPAYVVQGEGLFIELDESAVQEWEERDAVKSRVARLRDRYEQVREARGLRVREITPRLVLVHTLAHVLMNRLTYECGYSSAALRERLYTAAGDDPMAAVLIYTAAGDAEGTMGGLVRMGRAGYFEPALRAAIEAAHWCSSDPVCMEIGEAGQGPDSCNMAACHGCALVPETACEEFNRFLDRALLVGTHSDTGIGFWTDD
jgi:hypothetical protein